MSYNNLSDQQAADLEAQLRAAASEKGVAYDPSDLAGIDRHAGDEGSNLDQALRSTLERYDVRATDIGGQGPDSSIPGGYVGASAYAPGSYGTPPPPASTYTAAPPTVGITTYPRDGGIGATQDQLDQLLSVIQDMNNQPGVDLSNLNPGTIPTIEVPGENLSPSIDDTLMTLMGGVDPLHISGYLKDLLARTAGGAVGQSPQYKQRLEQAREALTSGELTARRDLGGVLADRGLISQPGALEGAELDSTARVFEPLQRTYLDALRSATVEEGDRADLAERDALQRATGWTADQVNTRLAAANSAGARQKMLSDVALGTLDRNIAWNEFLAQFGLDREKAAADIQQGRMDAIGPIIQMFLLLASNTQRGFI